MGKHDALAKGLAIVGTLLLLLPLLVPLVFSLQSIGRPGGYHLDYLLPFEVYPVTLVGAALLVWASFRARSRKRAVGISIAVMLGSLVLTGIAAQVTGIANSEEELEAWRYVLTAGMGGISLLAQIALAVVGCLLIGDLFRTQEAAAPPLTPDAGA